MATTFINRHNELKVLTQLWKRKQHSFIVIYGKRRVGKTRLIYEFIKNKKGIYITAEDTKPTVQIREFKNALATYLNDSFLHNQEFSTWHTLFTYLEQHWDTTSHQYLWIDEFSYLLKNNQEIPSLFQKFIDRTLKFSNTILIVSGSLFGLMQEKILHNSSPLYGRRSKDLFLQPLTYTHAKKFLSMSFEDSLSTFMTIGGVPEYLQVASHHTSFTKFLQEEFFSALGYFYRELIFLLSLELKEIRTYISILQAIAHGKNLSHTIADYSGIEHKNIYSYLTILETHGFVYKEYNFRKVKEARYNLADHFIYFWFRFVQPNKYKIETGNYFPTKQSLNQFLGSRFEIFITSHLAQLLEDNTISEKKRFWYKDIEIDCIASNKSQIYYIEIKYRHQVNPNLLCKQLIEKITYTKAPSDKTIILVIVALSFKNTITTYETYPVICMDMEHIKALL